MHRIFWPSYFMTKITESISRIGRVLLHCVTEMYCSTRKSACIDVFTSLTFVFLKDDISLINLKLSILIKCNKIFVLWSFLLEVWRTVSISCGLRETWWSRRIRYYYLMFVTFQIGKFFEPFFTKLGVFVNSLHVLQIRTIRVKALGVCSFNSNC